MSKQTCAPRRRHPSALYCLSLVEFFERLALGAVLPLFVLYLHEYRGQPVGFAIALSSGFVGTAYLAGLPGGYLADRVLGPVWAARLGLMLMAAGLSGMIVNNSEVLWLALAALLLGQGLFKPGITTMVSKLYPSGDCRREAGFSIFYVAVNLGALAGPFLAELIRIRWGWSAIFVGASAALLPALILLAAANGNQIWPSSLDTPMADASSSIDEKARSNALFLLCGTSVVFWLAFQQTATTLALFAEHHTINSFSFLRWNLPARQGHFAALHAALVIGFTPLVLRLFGYLQARQLAPSTPRKIIWGFLFTAAAFALVAWAGLRQGDKGRVSPHWLGGCYVLLAIGELLLSPIGLSLVTALGARWSKELKRIDIVARA